MSTIRIAAVSYINTYPFVEGLTASGLLPDARLILDVPSACARSFAEKTCDIALLPVGAMQKEDLKSLIGIHCLGTNGGVKTVVLLSNTPIHRIKSIKLDSDSSTSVQLVRILAENYWIINPEFIPADNYHVNAGEGIVLIGDKVFSLKDRYEFCYDLSDEWLAYSRLPFVFAVWAKTKPIDSDFEERFNNALSYGISRIPHLHEKYDKRGLSNAEMENYLTHAMNYTLDDKKMEALSLFLDKKRG
ncbi:MAG: menaquinone biosynthesis protein [Bacteroidales bacterium]|nr:menaquinone biosynthesis protein [Bacteroidales bacterium]